MSLMTDGSISKKARLMDGTPYFLPQQRGNVIVFHEPRLIRIEPSLPPFWRWCLSAISSCSPVMRFSLTSSSPDLSWHRLLHSIPHQVDHSCANRRTLIHPLMVKNAVFARLKFVGRTKLCSYASNSPTVAKPKKLIVPKPSLQNKKPK